MVLLRARFIVTPKIALRAVVSYTAVSPLLIPSLLIGMGGLFSVTLRCKQYFGLEPYSLFPELDPVKDLDRHAALRSSDFPLEYTSGCPMAEKI